MRRFALSFLIVASLLCAAQSSRKAPKPPDLEIIEATAQRTEGNLMLDGKIRNSGTKSLFGLVLLIDFLAPGKKVIATKRAELDIEELAPGAEAEFHARMVDPVRAVHFRINSEDKDERELRVAKNGPFPIY
jgi:hypothetical protein